MPGGLCKAPERPHKLWSFSRARLRLSNGGGVFFFFFGLLFSSTGLLALGTAIGFVLERGGFLPCKNTHWDGPLWCIFVISAIGAGHLFVGSLCLMTFRTTFDRDRNSVRVHSGWLGLRCQRQRLSDFRTVTVLSAVQLPAFKYQKVEVNYDIALEDAAGYRLVVGKVTQSLDLAHVVADEIAAFTGLPSAHANTPATP